MADGSNGADQILRSYIERIERLDTERAQIAEDIKEIYKEAKSGGFDPAIMRMIIRERKQDAQKLREVEELLDIYRMALGMLNDTPLGDAALRDATRGR